MPTPSSKKSGKFTVLLISFAASGCLAVASAAELNMLPIPRPAPITTKPAPKAAKPLVIEPADATATGSASAQKAVPNIAKVMIIILLFFNIFSFSYFNVLHELPCQ